MNAFRSKNVDQNDVVENGDPNGNRHLKKVKYVCIIFM